jgi:hypothetical protein
MSSTVSPLTGVRTLTPTAMIAAAMVFAGASSTVVHAQTLEGVWGVVTQPVDCTTNAPVGPPERGLLTFNQGGTLSDSSAGLAFAPGQRSAAHGTWASAGGSTYTARLVALIVFDTAPTAPPGSPVFQTGWLVSTNAVTLAGADRFTATAAVQFFNLARTAYRTACATRVGERFR